MSSAMAAAAAVQLVASGSALHSHSTNAQVKMAFCVVHGAK